MNFVLRSGTSVSFMVDYCWWYDYFIFIPPFSAVGCGGGLQRWLWRRTVAVLLQRERNGSVE